MECNPTRLLCPWNSPDRSTEVGVSSILQEIFPTQGSNLGLLCYKQIPYRLSHFSIPVCLPAKSLQSCLTLCDPMDHSPLGSSVHGILQARILAWVAIPFSRDRPHPGIEPTSLKFPALGGRFFTTSATWEAHSIPVLCQIVLIFWLFELFSSHLLSSQ